MGLFNFSKKNPDPSPEQIIQRLIEYMPDFYVTLEPFKNSIEFVAHNEFNRAIKSLIELADETGHYFSEDFWSGLADAAGLLSMPEERKYCQDQIIRNQKEIKFGTSFDWTTIKIDDNNFQHHISSKLKEEWAVKRREKDGVSGLINNNGIHLKSNGRSGFIYFIDGRRVAELEFELGVKGLILYYNSLINWSLPVKEMMTSSKKQNLKEELQTWSQNTGNAIAFE